MICLEGGSRSIVISSVHRTPSSLIEMLMEDTLKSKILAEYHGCSSDKQSERIPAENARSSASVHVIRNQSSTLTQQEENHIKRLQNENRPRRAPIASALIENKYRIHLKLSAVKGVISTTLITVTPNPPPTFLDHLLTSHRSSYGEHKNEIKSNNNVEDNSSDSKRSASNSGISSRIVLVSTYFCKESLSSSFPNKNKDKNKNIMIGTLEAEKTCSKIIPHITADIPGTVTDIAQNGFIYHNHRFQFLLSKDPKEKISYFLQDNCSDRIFPDANSVRNFVADFSSQPSIFRAGEILPFYCVL